MKGCQNHGRPSAHTGPVQSGKQAVASLSQEAAKLTVHPRRREREKFTHVLSPQKPDFSLLSCSSALSCSSRSPFMFPVSPFPQQRSTKPCLSPFCFPRVTSIIKPGRVLFPISVPLPVPGTTQDISALSHPQLLRSPHCIPLFVTLLVFLLSFYFSFHLPTCQGFELCRVPSHDPSSRVTVRMM